MSHAPKPTAEQAETKPGKTDQHPVKSISIVKRCLVVTATCLMTLVTLVSLLLFTHVGNTLLWHQLRNALPPLDGELTEGQLMTGWKIRNLSWQDHQIAFQADDITLKWQPGKLLTRQLPVQLVEVKNVSLVIQPTTATTTTTTTTEPSEQISGETAMTIPLDILINQINIQNVDVTVSGTMISLETFTASARLQNSQLFIPDVRADNLRVLLTDQESTTPAPKVLTPKKPTPTGIDLSTITLPEVNLPIPVSLENFTLTNARYQQGNIDETLKTLKLSFNWQANHIDDLKLEAEQTRATILLSGEIQLSERYPLNLNLNATILDDFNIPDLAAIKGDNLSLEASGDLGQLQLRLATQGSINSSLEGNIGPLAPNFPLNFVLKWPELQWPLQKKTPGFSASNGFARMTGNLNQYQFSLDTAVKVAEQPTTQLRLNASGSLQQLTIETLSLSLADEKNRTEKPLQLTGNLDWKEGISWQGQIQLSQLKPALWLPDIPGMLNGKINTQFIMTDGSWQLSIPELNIKGTLLNSPLELTGKLKADSQTRSMALLPFRVNIQNLYATLGDNRLDVIGHIAEQVSMTAKLDAKSLDTITPRLKGSLQGRVKLTGSDENPTLLFNFDSPSIDVQQTRIDRLQVNGKLAKATLLEGKITVAAAALHSGNIQLEKLLFNASGSERHHQISLKTRGEPVSGELQVTGRWQGAQGKQPGKWQGQLASARVITLVDNWSLEQPVNLLLNATDETVKLADQCWLAKPARLCIDASTFSANRGTTRFQLSDFNLSNLKPLLPGNLDWQAVLSASGDIQWDSKRDSGHPMAHIQIQTTPGEVTGDSDNPVSLKYQTLATIIKLNKDDLQAALDFDSKQLGIAHINLAIDNLQSDQTLSGQARLQAMHLNVLQPLIPDIGNIAGILSADTRMGGTLKAPLLFGNLTLRDGRLTAKQEMVTVSNLITELNMDGNKGKVSGSMKVGDGKLDLSGNLDWQQMPPSGVVTIQGQNLGAKVPGMLQLRASPDLKLTIGKAQTLTGNITIPWARVNIKQLPRQAVKPSDDVVIITPGTRETVLHAGLPFSMDVNVVLGNDIKIDAYGLKSDLGGHLLLDLQPGKPLVADGSIQLINGGYHQFGQDLLIKEGNIIFSGPLTNPYLAVNAIRNPDSIEGDVSVGIQVSGPPSRPTFSIYSDPPMPQQDQWSYLLRGRGIDDGDSSAVQSMLIDFGVSQFGGVVTSIGKKIGLSDVTLDTQGSGDDTQVTIGGTVAPGLRVQYGAGVFNSIAEVKVRYELMPRLYLQAISGLAQAVDLFYQFKIETGKK
ncbi:translocation/assembly module TamB domain-containing protein [Endozoicomonas sp. SCSIO W0465]|uniref:autotransporter assembly complex protein TamB n=1 Tax=Endozoicomonas sp. SCSIO W0465 TaxID=2918516 RepID=UPI0020750268|nr:translocation/assembly module TamB domain-containing protein [Endozoicomonas sp. SCSIO W0465]USE36955.1 translocation/assembly module TamB [Endozoicomonas sp. SCSIO W0465]